MGEEPTTTDESWEVEPSKKASSRRRKALRIALIVVATCGILAILAKTYTTYKDKADKAYDAYCMEKYEFDAGLATTSGMWHCSICGQSGGTGDIYVGDPLPKPRPSAPKHIVESYNRKMKQIERLKPRKFSHDCSGL